MKNFRLRLQILLIAMALPLFMSAQEIRYVKVGGAGAKNGSDWSNAYANIQDAINDLVNNNKTGEVWVAVGRYYPTETTESSSSPYYKSFKIPAGITVRGGFRDDLTDGDKGQNTTTTRPMRADKNFGTTDKDGFLDGERSNGGVYYWSAAPSGHEKQTILCGDLTPSKKGTLKWNKGKQQFDAQFYGNSYHVVWFAMNGFSSSGRANALSKPAKLEGCVVEGGHAYTSDANSNHPHMGYGGGIYMVANSFVYNCEVRNCDASRNGGGIYMDGGGIVRRTYVHDCQALGLGTEFGMGGGICENGGASNSKSNPIVVAQSVVTNCVGRLGGGMALSGAETVGNSKYTVVANSTLVNNNTAQVEAGGVYTYKGGGLASMTIVNNKCVGSGITQNGSITGRSGGVYTYDAAYIGNTVIWGNECEANKNMQFAASRSSLDNKEKSHFYHNALSYADLADWSTTDKMGVVSLESVDQAALSSKSAAKGYPMFVKPVTKDKVDANGVVEKDSENQPIQVHAAGYHPIFSDENATPNFDWTVYSESALTHAGINTADLDNEGLTPAPTGKAYDMQFGEFNARPTIGAFIAEKVTIAPKVNGNKEEYFVDPDFIYSGNNTGSNGVSWNSPARFLGNVLDKIAADNKTRNGEEKEVIVYVKEGTVDNTRTESPEDRVRLTALDIPSNVTILGSYNSSLTDTDLSKRNPVLTPTVISAKLMNEYKFNVAHLIKINNGKNITIDGFKLTFANANSTELANTNRNGAAITLKNCEKEDGEDSPNIHFRNITVSNCFGDKGTVVYADNASADFENCIFHNNTTATIAGSGLVYGIKSDLRFNHCNVLRSVGHASYLDANTKNEWKNSMFYGNLDRQQDNTNNCETLAIAAFDGEGVTSTGLTGERCMFDLVSRPLYDNNQTTGINLGKNIPAQSTYYKRTSAKGSTTIVDNPNGLEYAYTSGWANGYPRMVNPTKNAGYSEEGDVTYYGRATSFEPHNDNPVVNAAGTDGLPHNSWGNDITTVITRDFGGLPDIGAVESHVASSDQIAHENGNPDGQMPYGVAYYVRDYAQDGMPKTYTLNSSTGVYTEAADGKGNYVDENGTKIFLDGASWQYAVSGNANYGRTEEVKTNVNTEWKAEKTAVVTTFKGFKIHNSTSYVTVNTSGALTVTTEANAAVWTVSGVTTAGGMSAGAHSLSTVVNGKTYYLNITSTAVNTSSSPVNLTLTASGAAYTIRTGSNNYLRLRNGALQRSTTSTAWTFNAITETTGGNWVEVSVPSEGTSNGASVTNGSTVNVINNLHVYTSIDDITNLGTANAVTYKIKLAGSDFYAYDNAGSNHYIRATNAVGTAQNFALISTGKQDLYYLYDVSTGRYLYNYGSGNNPIRTDASNRSEWRITNDASNASSFNITLGTEELTNSSQGWNYYPQNFLTTTTHYINYKDRSAGAEQEWVLVAQKDYQNKTYTKSAIAEVHLNGLQYAVNTVHEEFVKNGEQHQVHVAAGTYTNKTGAATGDESAKNVVSQPYAYMMQEGVNVLGGYPNVGNPGEEQRQPKEYETILQPQENSPYVAMSLTKGTAPAIGGSQKGDMMQVSDWGANVKGNNENDPVSIGRVLVQPKDFAVQTSWDGFTLQHGYLKTAYMYNIGVALSGLQTHDVRTAGGAGVLLQGNGMIVNCDVTDNLILCVPRADNMITTGGHTTTVDSENMYTYHIGGAGVFMTGTGNNMATVENCNIGRNQTLTKAVHIPNGGTYAHPDHIWMYGAGLYQDGGNVYNTIIHDNTAATIMGTTLTGMNANYKQNNEMLLGAGAFISSGNFYNNTVVNNVSGTFFHCHKNHCSFAGIHVKNEARIYNTLIADNVSNWGYKLGWTPDNSTSPGSGVPVSAFDDNNSSRTSRDPRKVHVTYSFVNANKGEHGRAKDESEVEQDVWIDLTSTNDTGNTNIYLNSNPNVSGAVDYEDHSTGVEYHTTKNVYYKTGENQYKLQLANATLPASPCINTGTEDIENVVIPDFDAGYDDRVQDCRIDIGAYESNGKANITATPVNNQIIFYVTPEGKGSTNGSDPENAACAQKLQMVIDAAGRAKLQNPDKQVIVKVANSYELYNAIVKKNEEAGKKPGDDGYEDPTNFTYYATRTTDENSTDTRLWSIQIPRGVEVEGGYTDANADGSAWTNSKNGFLTRDITGNPTYFDSYFYNKDMKINATTYHVVTFTERIFDADGKPYLASDYSNGTLAAKSSYTGSERDEALFLHMSEVVSGDVIKDGNGDPVQIAGNYASNRAVLDGIFVTGGNADGKALSGSNTLNANGYGGAAIVTDYAYVRNCIVKGNSATNGGGLALTDGALVSGSLIIENNADKMGGGLYVFEDGATLTNGISIDSKAPEGQPMDYNMAHVLTSTIVDNNAYEGGGVWFSDNEDEVNARFNSVVIWQNTATEQANVYGAVNPEQPTEDETISEVYYPFAYSVIQNIRPSGTNNMSTENFNSQGVRFVNEKSDVKKANPDNTDMAEELNTTDKLSEFGYYGLTQYSILCSNGMPVSMYNELKKAIAISDDDILGVSRITTGENFVEVGARALALLMPKKQLMLRLFVANPEDVDTETAVRFMRLSRTAGPGTAAEYYSQMGSSFAFPFNSLQNALDYIKMARNGEIIDNTDAQNLPFEIIVGKGFHYPKKDLNGETKSVWAQTFAIPEGVTIIGGFDPMGGNGTYYGRYYEPKSTISTEIGSINDNVDVIPISVQQHKVDEVVTNEIGRGYNSANENVDLPEIPVVKDPHDDNITLHAAQAAKTVTFQQWHIQDIADRRAMNDNNKNGIIEPWEFKNQTIISGNAVNGETDGVYHVMTAVADAHAVGNMPKVQSENSSWQNTGYQVKEVGQQIRLNGLIITGGNALTYLETALDDYGSYIFYQGAGLQVDGNRYSTSIDKNIKPVFHNSAAYGVGYRDIPVSITNCQFRNNKAGYGGAISTNGSLSIFGSSFEQNLAIANTEKPDQGETWTGINSQNITEVNYPGQGGAILATRQLSAFNTLFANNEARYDDTYYAATAPTAKANLFSHKSFRVPSGAAGTLRAAGGAIMMGSAAEHHIVNCDFVRNKANMYPAVFTMNPTKQQTPNGEGKYNTHNYSQIINTVAWGNEVNKISSDPNYLRASKLMVNVGKKTRTQEYITDKNATDFYDPSFAAANVPTDADLASTDAESTTWQEAVWFCAYEDGAGFKQVNTNDLRDAITYAADNYAPVMIKTANKNVYQNCNIQIVADNGDVAGPNFGSPSVKAGFDGFMEGADWSPARFNRLTDNGNGWINQTVDPNTLDVTFNNVKDDRDTYQGAYSVTHYLDEFPEYALWTAIGNEKYMQATNQAEAAEQYINDTSIGTPQKNLPRISADPTKGVQKAYIDIGVYEYMKQALLKPGSEVDILWVSTKEHPENGAADGSTWKTPTSDLQRAIETLLSSRNGHKKEIRIMEGEYAPVQPKTVNGTKYNAFVIDTKSLNGSAITPNTFNDGSNNAEYFAQSLTIKGGYSSELMYEYDPVEYKTVIRQNDGNGNNTDYLIYVADPTVRYAGTNSGLGNNNATFGSEGEAASVKTMPIQVDGVTLINDKANANVKGSAIYYPDYEGAKAPESNISGAHSVSAGGQVVYYETKADLDAHKNPVDHETEYAEITSTGEKTVNDTKLLITKTEIIGSGKPGDVVDLSQDKTPSAVYIGQKGGAALIYNSVFHSNYGMPLDAYNTINVNNTFGKNTGMVRLQNAGGVTYVQSQMHNTALWRNNNDGAQVLFGATAPALTNALFTYNSFTGCTETTDGTADNNYNTALVNDNSNIGEGPNFVDPENADIFARNFDIKPSIRLLNKGNDESITSGTGKYYTLVVNNKYDFSLASTTDKDVLNRARLAANRIDIGAYEFQGSLSSILYVDPNKSHNDAATGENWEQAFGYGDLQDAVDLASISHATDKTQESYVFVKGNSSTNTGQNTNETLTIRDGVTVYGSIGSDYTDWHNIKQADGTTPKYNNVDEFIADMKSQREGVASNASSKTIVTGIKTSDGEYDGTTNNTPALVDGFVVTDPNSPKTPVLDVTNPSENAVIVIRNVVVADNDLSSATDADVNVAQISNGLIYEVLMRDNKPKGNGAVLKVANNPEGVKTSSTTTSGYAVNVTVEGKTVGANNTMPVDGENESATQIFKSITNSINAGEGANAAGANAPYKTITNKDISGYFYNIADPNLNYQLTETSKYIDMCEAINPLTGVADNLAPFINYTTDRDILGNPRLLTGVTTDGKIDRGAFETWKVENDINGFTCGDNGTIASSTYNATYNNPAHATIKKHFYPHDGSVVYVMEGQSLVIDAFDPEHEVKPTPENPGYLLVKNGASFYGNGRPVTAAYVAIERNVRKGGSIVAVPYAMDYDDKYSVAKVDPESHEMVMDTKTGSAYKYSSNERMDWKYIFQTTDSKCWDQISTATANQGVLFEPNGQWYANDATDNTEALLRFTAKGTALTDYVYTETVATSKDVILTKNDDAESTNNGADFTKDENMSWNCFGLPYLVSDYKTYETAETYGKSDDYMMNVPHTLWLFFDGVHTPDYDPENDAADTKLANGDGGYYSVKSWSANNADWHVANDAEKAIWVGEGIFTQTATLKDTEALKFYRPVAPVTFAASAPRSRYFYDASGIQDANSTEAAELIATEYYTADGVRVSNMQHNAVTIIRKIYSNGAVQTTKKFMK